MLNTVGMERAPYCVRWVVPTENPADHSTDFCLLERLLSDHSGINGELLANSEHVRVRHVVPLSNLHEVDAKARADTDQGISGGHSIDNVISIINIASIGKRGSAAYILEFFFSVDGHLNELLCHLFCVLLLYHMFYNKASTETLHT